MSTVVPLRPPPTTCRYGYSSDQALEIFAELRSEDSRIFPVQHAYERMALRDVSYTQVLRILRRGRLTEGPHLSELQLWRMTYRADSAGQDISVVVDIDKDQMGNMIAVITVVVH